MHLRFIILIALALTACGADKKAEVATSEKGLWEEFSGERALRQVQALVDFGPRPPGSDALEKARVYMTKELETLGWKVERQTFSDRTPEGQISFTNLIATFPGKTPPSFLLASHYDTKLFTTERFVGANDGGSSNGILLEMARLLPRQPELAAKVQLVFFDGEEAYVAFTDTDGLYGSRYFARQLKSEGKAKQFRGGILFDMVGDKNLNVIMPIDSPRELAAGIFAAADELKLRSYFTYGGGVMDDHTPINAIGIPMIDLIDFDFPSWHTPEDTMDKISAESLRIVGSVALRYLVDQGLK